MIDFGVYVPTIKPSDILILLALLAVVGSLIFSKNIRSNTERNKLILYWGKYALIFIGFLVVGSFWSFFILKTPFSGEFFAEWVRFGISIICFFLALFLGCNNERNTRFMTFAFISALVLIPLIFLPESEILHNFLVTSPVAYSLLAFYPSTIALASFLIMPIIFFFSLFFLEQSWKKYIFWIITMLLVALIIWTCSRAGWLAAFLGMISVVVIKALKEGRIKKIFLHGFVAIVLLFVIGFLVLSRPARNTALLRISSRLKVDISLTYKEISGTPTLRFINFLESFPLFGITQRSVPAVSIDFSGDRRVFWAKYFKRALLNPLGVGPEYTAAFSEKNGTGYIVNAHSLWLQVALSAGIGGIIVFLGILYRIGMYVIELVKKKDNFITYTLAGAFIGLMANSTFFDALSFRWFWIILGIIAAFQQNEKTNSSCPDYPISKDINWFKREIAQFYSLIMWFFSGKGLSRIALFKKINIAVDEYIHKAPPKFVYIGKNILYLDQGDSLGLSFQSYEAYTTFLISKFLRGGDVFVDIGANIGYYTILGAEKIGAGGKVFAFEPEKENFLLLQKNVVANGFTDRVILSNRAISDCAGERELFICSYNPGGHSLFNPGQKPEIFITPHVIDNKRINIEIEKVRTTTLDNFLGHGAIVNFIKMDIQGAEGSAQKGMLNILKNNPQIIIISEFWPAGLVATGNDPKEYLIKFLELGFSIYDIDEHKQSLTSMKINQFLEKYTPLNSKSTNLLIRRD